MKYLSLFVTCLLFISVARADTGIAQALACYERINNPTDATIFTAKRKGKIGFYHFTNDDITFHAFPKGALKGDNSYKISLKIPKYEKPINITFGYLAPGNKKKPEENLQITSMSFYPDKDKINSFGVIEPPGPELESVSVVSDESRQVLFDELKKDIQKLHSRYHEGDVIFKKDFFHRNPPRGSKEHFLETLEICKKVDALKDVVAKEELKFVDKKEKKIQPPKKVRVE